MIAELALSLMLHDSCTVTYSITRQDAPFTRAVQDIERTTGLNLVRVPRGADVKITLRNQSATDRRIIAEATSKRITIWKLYNKQVSAVKRNVWRHEWGHVLGLTHTANRKDIMYWKLTTKNTSTREWGARLRALYRECR